jgi:Holliday junction resolvase
VAWLEGEGWTVLHQADTTAGDHGVDIVARRGPERLAIEVKGYPQATYARGEHAGELKRWHPGAQARTYFGTGLHAAIIQRDRAAGGQVVLALPDVKTYRTLLDQVRSSLRDLGIRAFLVAQDGSVYELRR